MKSIVLDKIFAMIGSTLLYHIRFYRKLGLKFDKMHIAVTQSLGFFEIVNVRYTKICIRAFHSQSKIFSILFGLDSTGDLII